MSLPRQPTFRERLRARRQLIGTFVKTPAHSVVEVLGLSGLDFVVLDAEHAPFDRAALDICILAGRSVGLPTLVRIPDAADSSVLNVLDLGGTGVVVPHALDAGGVNRVLGAARYRGGRRGFSNSPRAGAYGGLNLAQITVAADGEAVVVCQIEDSEAIANVVDIVNIEALDCLFIGRADLAVSYGVDNMQHPLVADAIEQVCRACAATGKAVGIFLPDTREMDYFVALGVTMFVIGSDQSMLRKQASLLRENFSA